MSELPVDTFREAAPYLRRPFTTEAVRFKVQSSWASGALIVGYIDAHLVIERLNLVCPEWHDAYEPTASGLMWCHLTVGGITRSDVGDGQGKGLVSDALKRAATKFGVGVSLKRLPRMVANDEGGHLKRKASGGGKETVTLTSKGEQHVRDLYKRWLAAAGEGFGAPLDHGDIAGAVGDHEVEATSQTLSLRAAAMEAMSLAGIDEDIAAETVDGADDDKLREITRRAIARAREAEVPA